MCGGQSGHNQILCKSSSYVRLYWPCVESPSKPELKHRCAHGEMHRAISHEEQDRRKQDRFTSTLVIAASIIAAVRLARDDIGRPSPRLTSAVAESVGLARMILEKVVR
jgi:hypothetical protein